VTSLDAARTWFRYHRLFADLLGNELRRAAPTTRIRALHRAAAQWWEEHGYAVEAVRHAQAAHDWENAARMMSDHNLDLLLDGRVGTIRALVEAFPSNVRTRDPGLAIVSAGVAISDGLLGDAQVYLDHARRHAPEVPEKLRRRFELRLASGELWLASWRGDMEGVLGPMRALEEALAAPTPEELARDNDTHASALMNLGIAELWSSRLDDARRHLEQALDLARRIRRPYIEVNVLAHLGIALALTGSPLSATEELADEAIALGEAHGWGKNRVLDAALAARGTVLVWLGRFDEAERSVRRAEHTLRSDREPGLAFVVHYATALLHAVHGRFEEALAALTAAESARRILASEHTLSLELDSRMIRTQVALGNTAAARTSLERIAPPLRERTIIRTAEATLLLAEGDPPGAIDVLAPALAGSPLRHIPWPLIQALLCDAAARTQLGDTRGATASLDRALEIAEPEQVILPFVLPPARDLMLDRARHGSATSPLLAAILEVLADSPAAPGPELPPEAEELSPAELRVLGFLPSDLNAGEIADRLYVSPNTVRTHVRHIYSKLAAHNRRQAVARARELGLLVRR
jgi:LuxR family maltose regulon positive regulatory protein